MPRPGWKQYWMWGDSPLPGVLLVFMSSLGTFLYLYFQLGLDEVRAGIYGMVVGLIAGLLYNLVATLAGKKTIHIADIILFDFWW